MVGKPLPEQCVVSTEQLQQWWQLHWWLTSSVIIEQKLQYIIIFPIWSICAFRQIWKLKRGPAHLDAIHTVPLLILKWGNTKFRSHFQITYPATKVKLPVPPSVMQLLQCNHRKQSKNICNSEEVWLSRLNKSHSPANWACVMQRNLSNFNKMYTAVLNS